MKQIEIRNQTSDTVDIYVLGVIGETFTAAEFISTVSYYKDYSINIHIFSPGGLAFEALAVYDFIKGFGVKGTVYIYGLAGSAATIISSAFDNVMIGENSKFYIHNAYGGTDKGLADINDTITNIYKNKTGLRSDTIRNLMKAGDEGDFMNAKKAKELGFVNGIFKEDSINNEFQEVYNIAANYDINQYKLKHIPMEEKSFLDKILNRINEGFVTKVAHEELQNQFNELKEEQKKYDSEKQDYENTIVSLTEQVATSQNEIEAKVAEATVLKAATATATAKAIEVETELTTAQAEIENLKAKIIELEKQPVAKIVTERTPYTEAKVKTAREIKQEFLLGKKII